MPIPERVVIDVGDLTLVEPDGNALPLGALVGVQVLVLLRHRH